MKLYQINHNLSAIYSADSMGVFYFRRDLTDEILVALNVKNSENVLVQNLLSELRESNFFIKKNVSIKRPLRTLYFCTSYNCNLACSYCLTNGSVSCGRIKNKLSNENIEKCIKQFMRLSESRTEREVVIYGGEPTLYPDMIRFIYHTVRKYEIQDNRSLDPARFILCTNGTLIDDELADFIKESGIYPAVSFDGYPELHDKNRCTLSGMGSFEMSEKGYRLLQKKGIPTGVTMALGSHTVEHLPEIVKFLHNYFKPKTIAANSMLDFENNVNNWMPDSRILPRKLWETFLVCREEGIYLVKSIMDNRVKPFVEQEPRLWGCTGTGARMGVLPDGNIVPCMALSHKYYKHIDEYPQIDDYCPSELRNNSPYAREECKNCEAKATCGGGCPASAILSDSLSLLDGSNCAISKFFIQKLVELLWEETGREDIVNEIGYYIPTYEDRKKLYGNIYVASKKADFQYIPDAKH